MVFSADKFPQNCDHTFWFINQSEKCTVLQLLSVMNKVIYEITVGVNSCIFTAQIEELSFQFFIVGVNIFLG